MRAATFTSVRPNTSLATFGKWESLQLLYNKSVRQNPYPFYKKMRDAGHVLHSAAAVSFIPHYATIKQCYRDPRLVSGNDANDLSYAAGSLGSGFLQELPFRWFLRKESSGPFHELAQHFLLAIDGEDHKRQRRLVARGFNASVGNRIRENMIHATHSYIDELQSQKSFDVLHDYAYRLPVRVICDLLGLPAKDFDRINTWLQPLLHSFDASLFTTKKIERQADAAYLEFREYLKVIIDDRRGNPQDDMISTLVAVSEDNETLTEIELYAIIILLFGAGHETSANLIANSVWAFHNHPEQKELWIQNPNIRQHGVEELVRYEGPVAFGKRVATEDLFIDDVFVPKGRILILVTGSGNHDPEQFENPDLLDLERKENQSLGFGYGAHYCVGAGLAKVETEIALTTLYERLPNLRPVHETPEWRNSLTFRALKHLPVEW